MMNIQGIKNINNMIQPVASQTSENDGGAVNFKDLLMDALNNVNALEQEAAKMTEDFIAGRTDNIHSVMIAGEKASIALDFVLEVRNKVMEAYQEIMRMQI